MEKPRMAILTESEARRCGIIARRFQPMIYGGCLYAVIPNVSEITTPEMEHAVVSFLQGVFSRLEG